MSVSMSVPVTMLQRLRTVGLRPTTARIGVLQVIQAAGSAGIRADEVFLQMLQRGTHVSASTVYRIVNELQTLGVLLHDRSDRRHTLFRLRPVAPPPTADVRIACRRCERSATLPGAQLRNELELRAAEKGLQPLTAGLVLQVDCLGCNSAAEHCQPQEKGPDAPGHLVLVAESRRAIRPSRP